MKQLLVFLLLLCSASVSAQDVIVKKDGSTILCRVVEVTSTEITYKKWDNLNGSNYVMDKSLASAINYQNGKKVNLSEATNLYTPNNQNDGTQQYNDKALLAIDYAARAPEKKISNLKKTAWIGGGTLLAAGIAFMIVYASYVEHDPGKIEGNDTNDWALPVSLACVGGAAIWTTSFLLSANHQKKKAQSLQAASLYQYNFSLPNGSSFSVGADLLRDKTLGQNTLGIGLRYNF